MRLLDIDYFGFNVDLIDFIVACDDSEIVAKCNGFDLELYTTKDYVNVPCYHDDGESDNTQFTKDSPFLEHVDCDDNNKYHIPTNNDAYPIINALLKHIGAIDKNNESEIVLDSNDALCRINHVIKVTLEHTKKNIMYEYNHWEIENVVIIEDLEN